MLYTIPRKLFAHILSRHIRDIPKNGSVVDIGCGLGDLTRFTNKKLKRKTIGLDVDCETCKLASINLKGLLMAEIVFYDGTNFPFKHNAFHLAFAHEVIEHVEDDKEFFRETNRILMKGGLFIISTPNAAREPLSESFHRDHIRHYTKSELLAKLTEAGFTPIATYWRYHALGAKIDSILNRIGSKRLRQEHVQYGMTYWSVEHQSKLIKVVLQINKYIVDPLITALVLIEFEIKKTRVEAANMVIVCRK